MYYYSDREFKEDEKQTETKLTIETLVKKAAAVKEFDPEDEKEEPPLEALIRTKYETTTDLSMGGHQLIASCLYVGLG